jgi:hypothetical protein
MFLAAAAEHLADAVLDNVFVATLFRIHREMAISELVGLRGLGKTDGIRGGTAAETRPNGQEFTSIADSLRNKSIECKCFVCNRLFLLLYRCTNSSEEFPEWLQPYGSRRIWKSALGLAGTRGSFHSKEQNNVPLPFYDRARRRANNGNLLPGSSSVNGHSRSTRSSTLRSAAKLGHFNVYTTNDEEANRHQEFETNEDEMEQAKVEDGEEEVEDEQELVDNLRDRLRNKPTLNGNNNNRLNSMRIIRR